MVKCESLRMNMYRITHAGKISKFSRNTFSEQSPLNGSIKGLATEIITKGERCQEFSITNNSPKHAQVK